MSQSLSCSDIASSKIQKCFAVLETTPGVFAYPTKDHFIAITNDATANQAPEYMDSTEKLGTRDITERFRNAMPPATANIAMYMNVRGTGEKPQGYDMLLSMFGASTLTNPPLFTLGEATEAATTIPLASMDAAASLPSCGVIKVGNEQIYYDAIADDGMSLTGCKRGYNKTTPEAISDGTRGSYLSVAFKQDNCNPSFSLFLQTDHFLQCIAGCTVNDATLSLANEGAVTFEFGTIQGMRMVVAGTSKTTAGVPAGAMVIPVEHPAMYMPEAVIWCPTMEDEGSRKTGYIIASVDDEAGTLTLESPIEETWPAGAVVAGWIPQDTERIGEPIEGANTDVFMDGIRSKLRTSSLSYNNNITYLNDELGTLYPEGYVGDSRTIETSITSYFRPEDAVRFKEGIKGQFVHIRFGFGNGKAVWNMPRVQMTTPSTSIESPTVSLESMGTALSTGKGNDAVELVFN